MSCGNIQQNTVFSEVFHVAYLLQTIRSFYLGNWKLSLTLLKERKYHFSTEIKTFTSCAFSPNGRRLVTGDGSNTIKLWDVSEQSLLSLLSADVPVGRCSFSSTGLFIIGNSKCVVDISVDSKSDDKTQDGRFDQEDSFCVWNAITWQRSDERNLRDVKLKESKGTFQNKKCKRCFRPGIEELNSFKRLEVKDCVPFTFSGNKCEARSTGIYNGVECSFSLKDHTLSVMETTHFTMLAAWHLFVHFPDEEDYLNSFKLTTIEDDLWFYADVEKLFVFRTLAPIHQQYSRLPRPTRVLSSSFSPDGSQLATCTSDGYINIWNVNTNQVEHRFRINQGDSSFACWWSEKFLFVFDFFHRIPSLSKYTVDVNLKILFPQSQQVSLCHLLEEFVSLAAIVDFSEGLLSFECGETEPVKVLDVSGVGGPRMVTLPGIQRGMSIKVSPGASFVFGDDERMHYIWKRNVKEELDVYEIISMELFSNDSKLAVIMDISADNFETNDGKIFDLVARNYKKLYLEQKLNVVDNSRTKLFFLTNDRVFIVAHHHFLEFVDMDSGGHLGSSFQRYLTRDSLKQLKLSPKETMIAFPKINGDMEFLRLCIPQDPLLSSIKCEAATRWLKEQHMNV